MRTIGLDVHKYFAEVAVLEAGQEIRHSGRIRTTPTAFRAFAQTLRPTDHVVLEASMNTWPIAELLSAHAGRVVVSNPMRTRAIASAKVKTDRIDSAILAQLLAADFIPAVWIPDFTTQMLRRQVSHRQSLVQQSTRLRNRIHAVLQRNLIEHSFTDLFGKAGRRWLTEVPLPADERHQVDSALRLLDAVAAEIRLIEEDVAQAILEDQRVLRLMTIPGVGLHTATAVAAVIGDIKRFPRPSHLVGYLGLDPRVRQSGSHAARAHQPTGTGACPRPAGRSRAFHHSCPGPAACVLSALARASWPSDCHRRRGPQIGGPGLASSHAQHGLSLDAFQPHGREATPSRAESGRSEPARSPHHYFRRRSTCSYAPAGARDLAEC